MTQKTIRLFAVMLPFALLPALSTHALSEKHETAAEHTLVQPEQIEWRDGPPSLPQGARFAILEGDPAEEGSFTMRLQLPAGFQIPPHTHPRTERVTVLEGEFRLGHGREFREENLETLPPGGFFIMPPGMEHFAQTDRGTVIQLTGTGPWSINYINPEDDPRQQRMQLATP